MSRLEGSILTPNGWIDGQIEYSSIIDQIDGAPIDEPRAPFVIPGFVDLHVHGGAGYDMMEGEEAIRRCAAFHGLHGTTSYLATSVTAPLPELDRFLAAIKEVSENQKKGEARLLGAHLEGPFINPQKLGAQPPHALSPDLQKTKQWIKSERVRVMTLAPEMDEDHELIKLLLENGIKVQLGHSLCAYVEARNLIAQGCGVTHLYNAMSKASHRDNGLAGAALAHGEYAEIIPDLIHVEAGGILAARRAIPKLYGVTDATAGAGMEDGEFKLGEQLVKKSGEKITLPDGTLAGSVLTMDQALRNLVEIGIPLDEASRRLSTYPADWLGETMIGRLQIGAYTDMIVLNENLEITECYLGGEWVSAALGK